MGMKAFSDVDSLLAAAQLEGKSVYVIPNGSTVIPHVKEDTEACKRNYIAKRFRERRRRRAGALDTRKPLAKLAGYN